MAAAETFATGEPIGLQKPVFPIAAPETFGWAAMVVLLSLASSNAWLGVGRDYLEYVDYFWRIPPFFSFQDTRFEPGFHLVSWVFAHVLKLPYQALFFTVVFASLAIKAFLFKRYLTYPLTAMAVYLATFYPSQEYTQIRASLAISLGMLAIHTLFEKRFILTGVICLAGFSFHYSIILLFCAFGGAYVLRRNIPSLIAVSIGLLVIVFTLISGGGINNLLISLFSNFNPLVGSYVDNVAAIDSTSMGSINNLIVVAIFGAAAYAGWLSHGMYLKCFTIMVGLSIVFIILLSQSPIIAVRAKEMLMVSVIFASFRYPWERRDIAPIILVFSNAALLLFLAIREGVIFSV
ncbi:EpsG family protein [Sphingomonas sp. IC4-52]|uniref:EpsG family protein n=1 Tax=Sphingomonas sp. IC4-52 TaxID=2887202 RepID=UPI001D124886|nr:EpsG family protein [Sphingomonas sp. IC4-52]MCC2981665.1 EpsG family protein [Sphingomonas sp. IC4-52]